MTIFFAFDLFQVSVSDIKPKFIHADINNKVIAMIKNLYRVTDDIDDYLTLPYLVLPLTSTS